MNKNCSLNIQCVQQRESCSIVFVIFVLFQENPMPAIQPASAQPASSGLSCDPIAHVSVSASLNEICLITHRIGENATRLCAHLNDVGKSDTLRQMRALLDSIK